MTNIDCTDPVVRAARADVEAHYLVAEATTRQWTPFMVLLVTVVAAADLVAAYGATYYVLRHLFGI